MKRKITLVFIAALVLMMTHAAAAPRGQLVAQSAASAPRIDGQIDAVWNETAPLVLPLTWGKEGAEHAFDVQLRALYDEDNLYLLAQWREAAPRQFDADINKLTVHWQLGAQAIRCRVACHTAYVDPARQVRVINAETIPQGAYEGLPAAGGWRDGAWVIEWAQTTTHAQSVRPADG